MNYTVRKALQMHNIKEVKLIGKTGDIDRSISCVDISDTRFLRMVTA